MRNWISERLNLAAVGLVLAGLPGFPAAVADETDTDASPVSLETLLAAPTSSAYGYEMPGRFTYPDAIRPTAPAISSVAFRDGSTLGRLKRIRQLSLLTITDSGKSRVFLGVNHEGVFGIHLSFLNGRQSDRFAEVLRMPYLRDYERR